jgi:ribonuclease D
MGIMEAEDCTQLLIGSLPSLQHFITAPDALVELTGRLASADAIGLDTEFLRERTYRAELCLVQVADAAHAACIDPLALADLGPLAILLQASRPLKVMHASRQDLEVMQPLTGLVAPVFDTQIAAALTGFPAQVGYAELVRRVLGIELDKSHTRTDWSRRPLSSEQVAYALDDVRYLLPLKENLETELARLGRSAWLAEELVQLADEDNLRVEPERAWLRVKGLRGLDAKREALARALAAWRERRAIERNRPRGWILDDALLREVVLRVPDSPAALGAIAGMPPAFVKNCGEEVVTLVGHTAAPYPPYAPPRRERPDPERLARVKKLSAVLQATAAELALSPEILVTRRDLEKLAAGDRDVGALSGWRRAQIGERLLTALDS